VASEDVIAATEDVLASFAPIDVTFRETRRFPDVVYLAPEPADPFVEMTNALGARFPGWRPYDGRFPSIVPHLTIASGEALDAAEDDVSPRLPLHARAATALLLSEVRPQRWTQQAEFRLGGG
jgi:2'-5' RNA ligase